MWNHTTDVKTIHFTSLLWNRFGTKRPRVNQAHIVNDTPRVAQPDRAMNERDLTKIYWSAFLRRPSSKTSSILFLSPVASHHVWVESSASIFVFCFWCCFKWKWCAASVILVGTKQITEAMTNTNLCTWLLAASVHVSGRLDHWVRECSERSCIGFSQEGLSVLWSS